MVEGRGKHTGGVRGKNSTTDTFVSGKLNQQFLVENYKYITGVQNVSYIRCSFTAKSHQVFN